MRHITRCVGFIAAALIASSPAMLADAPAPDRSQARFEVDFLKEMINHHAGAVEMSKLCEGRTIHAELKEMCDEIIKAQSQGIKMMQSWLKDWYGITHNPDLDRRTERQLSELRRVTGAEFEKAYMTMMIEHHAQAVPRMLECLLRGYHPEMLNMCAMELGMQGDEIAQLRLWLCEWYTMCNLQERHHRQD
jgi:uncharacterized protein (DUF305 family)